MKSNLDEEVLERARHQDALLEINKILSTSSGQKFMKYLLQDLDYGEFPEIGLPENILHDRIGFLRAGQSVFKMIAQANPGIAGTLVGQIEKERYAAKT